MAVQIEGSTLLEATWTIIPLGLFLVMFVWGALIYFRIYTPPANAMNIYVVGKQWMWKAEHPGGQHEINSLHVPAGQPVQLTIISQDVFHSFSIPGVPREARGYSGPLHDGLVRSHDARHLSPVLHAILRHEPLGDDRRSGGDDAGRLQAWLAGSTSGNSLAQDGERLFASLSCNACHNTRPDARGPSWPTSTARSWRLPRGRSPSMMHICARRF